MCLLADIDVPGCQRAQRQTGDLQHGTFKRERKKRVFMQHVWLQQWDSPLPPQVVKAAPGKHWRPSLACPAVASGQLQPSDLDNTSFSLLPDTEGGMACAHLLDGIWFLRG